MADRTDWTQVFAEPAGGFEMVQSLVPVRVQRPDGSWVPVDTTLSARQDGSVAPAAITTGLSLSGGGAGPLFTLSQGGRSLAVSWPSGSLPAPVLSGATATYANVLPGVNLLVTAEPTGVSELVEVTSAQAAASPALAKITFPVAGSGLSVSADGQGNLTAADGAGAPAFTAAAPQMWDSAGGQAPGGASSGLAGPSLAASGLGGPVPGDHTASVGVSASAGSVALTPAGSVLSGPQVVYPVFIDPRWDGHKADATWLDVWKDGAGNTGGDWEPTDPTFGGIKSGVYCQDNGTGTCVDPVPDATWGIYRSYINFTLPSGFAGSNPPYVDAQLQIYEKWSWSCSPATLELWQANHADKGSTWNTRPQQLTKLAWPNIAYGHGSGCPAQTVFMDATPALQDAAEPGYGSSTVTFELRAADTAESGWNTNSWKRFDASSLDLVVFWRNAPSTPAGQGAQGVFNPATGQAWTHCSTSSSSPDWAPAASPVVQATINDVDSSTSAGAGNIDGFFPWTNVTAGGTGTLHASQNGANDETGLDPNPNGVPNSPGAQFTGAFPWTAGDVYS